MTSKAGQTPEQSNGEGLGLIDRLLYRLSDAAKERQRLANRAREVGAATLAQAREGAEVFVADVTAATKRAVGDTALRASSELSDRLGGAAATTGHMTRATLANAVADMEGGREDLASHAGPGLLHAVVGKDTHHTRGASDAAARLGRGWSGLVRGLVGLRVAQALETAANALPNSNRDVTEAASPFLGGIVEGSVVEAARPEDDSR